MKKTGSAEKNTVKRTALLTGTAVALLIFSSFAHIVQNVRRKLRREAKKHAGCHTSANQSVQNTSFHHGARIISVTATERIGKQARERQRNARIRQGEKKSVKAHRQSEKSDPLCTHARYGVGIEGNGYRAHKKRRRRQGCAVQKKIFPTGIHSSAPPTQFWMRELCRLPIDI